MDLSGKVAIVTGASAGIGAATVKALHGIGMKVVGFARRKERIEELIDDHDGRLFAVKVDLTNPQEILDGFAWVVKNVGPVNVLVNNAGIGGGYPASGVVSGEMDTWRKMIDTNFTSVLVCCREAIKNMQEKGVDGYIINVSSVAGIRTIPYPDTSVYSATKFALCGMTDNLRLELNRINSKIRTTCINPGVVKTEIAISLGSTKEQYEEMLRTTPHLQSEDVANTIKFLVQSPGHVQISTLTIQPVGEKF